MFILWIKAFHIIAVISWMAGLLYLPRLMVYHADLRHGSSASQRFERMERRLLRVIMTPAMIVTWFFGISLAYFTDAWTELWFWAKVWLVIGLTVFHFASSVWARRLSSGTNTHSAGFYRRVNEIPTFLMILIVIMVVVRPF